MSNVYSIWLIPDEGSPEYKALDQTIGEYAEKYPDAPDFRPHITVLGGIEVERDVIESKARELTDSQTPFEVEFMSLSCSTTTYQCVFLLANPSIELLSLNQRAVEELGQENSMYVPHLSLVYSDMPLQERLDAVHSVDSESLPNSIQISTVEVVDTGGDVPDWEPVAEYQL
ncbi:2'-5' RNA ligase family protein [Haloarchaeobius amylolyticus]|uniref:2'-5' RNA ligase family protein n=1 Tax=Haloarchaeobius amylolyticus TaxID=1198296 RepID=UPI00226F91FD|nr:2'-5' RNA ligase family protein [Haloarchaeobius amylolyticus]